MIMILIKLYYVLYYFPHFTTAVDFSFSGML